jgi:hypothetical protein
VAQQFTLHITSGLPYGRTIEVVLPNGRDWWTAGDEFEILSQIRQGPDDVSTLVLDLAQFMTMTFASPDTITIDFQMTGADTRLVTRSGYYDFVLSDKLSIDNRAYIILNGPVSRTTTITAGTEVV